MIQKKELGFRQGPCRKQLTRARFTMFTQHALPLSLTYHLHLGRNHHILSDPRSLLLSEVILPSGDVRGLK